MINIYPKNPVIQIENHKDPSSVFKYFNTNTTLYHEDTEGAMTENETANTHSHQVTVEEEEQTFDFDKSEAEV